MFTFVLAKNRSNTWTETEGQFPAQWKAKTWPTYDEALAEAKKVAATNVDQSYFVVEVISLVEAAERPIEVTNIDLVKF